MNVYSCIDLMHLLMIVGILYRHKTKQEADVLRSYLKAAQDDISILLEEKKALLDTIRSLQVIKWVGVLFA